LRRESMQTRRQRGTIVRRSVRGATRQNRELTKHHLAKRAAASRGQIAAHRRQNRPAITIVLRRGHRAKETLRDEWRDVDRQLRQGTPVDREQTPRPIETDDADGEVAIPQDFEDRTVPLEGAQVERVVAEASDAAWAQ